MHLVALRFLSTIVFAVAMSSNASANPHVLGIHVHNQKEVGWAALVGYGAIRLWDTRTSWRDLEPEPGMFRLEPLAARLEQAERLKLKVVLTLGSTPTWASSRRNEKCAYGAGCAAPPFDMELWRRYVRKIVTTFAGRIECYETWNEVSFPTDPSLLKNGAGGDPQFFSGTTAEMVALQRIAFEEIRAGDPSACVLSPSFHSTGDWIRKLDVFLAAGGGAFFDKLSFHFYFGMLPEDSYRNISNVREVMRKHGRGSVEIWNTEVGWPFAKKRGEMSPQDFRAYVFAVTLRTYLSTFGSGVTRLYWYAWDNTDLGLSPEASGAGTVVMEAAKATVELLRGVVEVTCPYVQVKSVWQCRLTYADGSLRDVYWSSDDARYSKSDSLGVRAMIWGEGEWSIGTGETRQLSDRPIVTDVFRAR